MTLTDPAPFYDAALTGANGASLILHDYPMPWRMPMIANVSLSTLRYHFRSRLPTPTQREAVIAMFTEDYPRDEEIGGAVNQLIDAAFLPGALSDLMAHVEPYEFAACALMVPPTIAVRYPWQPGERDDYITHLCTFDHTAFTD